MCKPQQLTRQIALMGFIAVATIVRTFLCCLFPDSRFPIPDFQDKSNVLTDMSVAIAARRGRNKANIATARAVRTLDVRRAPSHHVDTQTGRVACEFDF